MLTYDILCKKSEKRVLKEHRSERKRYVETEREIIDENKEKDKGKEKENNQSVPTGENVKRIVTKNKSTESTESR